MPQNDETSSGIPSQNPSVDGQEHISDEVVWDYAFPLLTNPFVMLDMCKVIGISFSILCLILLTIGAFQGGSSFVDMLHMIPIMAICMGVVAVIMVFVMLVIYRNRFPVKFIVNQDKAIIEVTPTQRKMNTAVIILGLLAGKPGTAGSGFLARAQESQSFRWVDVYWVDLYPRRQVVVLRNSWRTVARLYCTADNYETVARLAVDGVERTKQTREKNAVSEKRFRSQLIKDIFNRWLILCVVSFIFATASPLLHNYGPIWGIGISIILGFITRRKARLFFGVVGLVMVAGTILLMVVEGSKINSYAGGYIKFSNFESAINGGDLKFFILSVFGMLGLIGCTMRNIISGNKK